MKRAEELNNPQSQLNYINELLSYKSEQNSIYLNTVKTIEKELGFIRPFISSDLYYEIRGIWGRIKALTGTADFNFPFESSRAESWVGIYKAALYE